MVYEIAEMVAAGIPAELFEAEMPFRRGVVDGLLHAHDGMHEGEYALRVLASLTEAELCPCARKRPTRKAPELAMADRLYAAQEDLAAGAQVTGTAHARTRWLLMRELDALPEDPEPVQAMAHRLRAELAASLADRPKPGPAARTAWRLTAAAHLSTPDQLAPLALPAALRWGPGAMSEQELTERVRAAATGALESGCGWAAARTVALTTVRARMGLLGPGDPRALGRLTAAVEAYLARWRAQLDTLVGQHGGPDVIVAVTDVRFYGGGLSKIGPLLAPTTAVLSSGGFAVTAVVPPIVAAALRRALPVGATVAGPAARTDSRDTLATMAAVLENNPRSGTAADALLAARGILAPPAPHRVARRR